jgi:internalin A
MIASLPLAAGLLTVLTLTLGTTSAQDLFPDKGLEAAVRKEVFAKRYNTEPLTAEDVKRISQVKGKGLEITDLTGLEHCVAVQEIDLRDNQIVDLGPLRELKLLQSISLANNKIESLEPLKDLERTQYLELSGNAIADVSPLAKLINMRSLYLSNNKIESIEPLKGMKKVVALYLAGNPLKDLQPIGEMRSVDTLDLSGCGVEDLSFLKPLKLRSLNLTDNKIQSVAPLLEMAQADSRRDFAPFWRIYLKGNPIDTMSEQVQALQQLGSRLSFE